MNNQIVGVIGLGMMGVPMANNLLKSNFSVKGFDLNPSAKEKITPSPKFEWLNSTQDIAKSCNVIILMLPDSNIVDKLLWGDDDNGIVQSFQDNTLVIDMSSSKPTNSKLNAEKLSSLGF